MVNQAAWTLVAFLLVATSVRAGDFESEDFALRFSAAFSRLSTYSDVAGQGGASVASLRSTSINPASLSWRPLRDARGQPLRFALSGQLTMLTFHRGTDLWGVTESLNIYPSENFALKLSITQLRGNEAPIRGGSIFEFDGNSYRLDLSRRFDGPERTSSIGLQLNYAQTETNLNLPAGDYLVPTPAGPVSLPFRRQVLRDADRELYGVRLGGQMSLIGPDRAVQNSGDGKTATPASAAVARPDRLLAGLIVDYIYQPTKAGSYPAMPEGVRGAARADFKRIDYHQMLARAGLAWRYLDEPWGPEGRRRTGYLRCDYQWGWQAGRESELQVHRLYAGGNYPIAPFLHLQAGTTLDERRNVSWSAGLSFLMPTFALEASYQHDLLPEIGHEFGHADAVVISGGFAF